MKNAYEIRGEITAIYLKSNKYGEMVTLISTSKLTKAMEFLGSYYPFLEPGTKSFYVHGKLPRENGKQRFIRLHRWITEAPDGMFVDHINHKTLDNTDNNLRLCTNSENQQNQLKANSASKSGIRGVCWHKKSKKWSVQIYLNKKQIYLGCFDDIEEAKEVSVAARAKYFPYSQEAMGL